MPVPDGVSINKARPAPLGLAGNFYNALKKNSLYKNYNTLTGQTEGVFDEGDPNYNSGDLQANDVGTIPLRTEPNSLLQPVPAGVSVVDPSSQRQLYQPASNAVSYNPNDTNSPASSAIGFGNGIPDLSPPRSVNLSPLEGLREQLMGKATAGSPERYNPLPDLASLALKQQALAKASSTPYDLEILRNQAANAKNQALLDYQQGNSAPQIQQAPYQSLPTRQDIPIPVRGDAVNERTSNVAAGLTSLIGGGNTNLSSLQGLTEHGRNLDQRDYTDAQRLYGQQQAQADQGYQDAVASRNSYKDYLDQQTKDNYLNDSSKFAQGGDIAKLKGDVSGSNIEDAGLAQLKDKYSTAAQTKAEIDNQLEQITAKTQISDNDVKDYNTGVQTLEKVQGLISQGNADEAAKVLAQWRVENEKAELKIKQDQAPYKLKSLSLGLQGQQLENQGQVLKNQYTKAQTDKINKDDSLDKQTQQADLSLKRQALYINKVNSDIKIIEASKIELPDSLGIPLKNASSNYRDSYKAYETAKTREDAALLKEAKNPTVVTEGGFLGIGAKPKLGPDGKPQYRFSDAYNAKKAEAEANLAPLKADLEEKLNELKDTTNRATSYLHDAQQTRNVVTDHYTNLATQKTTKQTTTSQSIVGKVYKQGKVVQPQSGGGQLPPGVQVVN